jgi:hypothetical protein
MRMTSRIGDGRKEGGSGFALPQGFVVVIGISRLGPLKTGVGLLMTHRLGADVGGMPRSRLEEIDQPRQNIFANLPWRSQSGHVRGFGDGQPIANDKMRHALVKQEPR